MGQPDRHWCCCVGSQLRRQSRRLAGLRDYRPPEAVEDAASPDVHPGHSFGVDSRDVAVCPTGLY